MSGSEMPRGVVTFLFTDVEGSTWLFRHLEDRYREILEVHFRRETAPRCTA